MLSIHKTPEGLSILIPNTKQSNRQRMVVADFVKRGDIDSLVKYLSTLNGKHQYVSVPRFESSGTDQLASKGTGSILKLFRCLTDLDRSHAPVSKDTDWIGVEIECFIPYDSIDSDPCLSCDGSGEVFNEDSDEHEECCDCSGSGSRQSSSNARDALKELFREEGVRLTNVKYDGSINADSGHFAAEITVLTRLSRPDNLKQVCSILNRLGAKVNKSCGMHVHLDARHLDGNEVKVIGRKFERSLPVLAAMVPPTRRSNTYCKLSVSGLRGDRYHAVNLTAFGKYRTIEVRLHSSTTSFEKIIQWSTLLSCIARAERIPRQCRTLNELTDFVRVPESTLEYASQRTELFSPSAPNAPVNASALDQDSTDEDRTQLEIGA